MTTTQFSFTRQISFPFSSLISPQRLSKSIHLHEHFSAKIIFFQTNIFLQSTKKLFSSTLLCAKETKFFNHCKNSIKKLILQKAIFFTKFRKIICFAQKKQKYLKNGFEKEIFF